MSATIGINNSKFVIFGSGYDYTRADSGEGSEETEVLEFQYSVLFSAIDANERYCWISAYDNGVLSSGIHKFDIEDEWNEVSQSIIPTDVNCILLHPVNTDNNIGIAITDNGNGADVIVFDLTDETIINSGTIATMPGINVSDTGVECILVGNNAHFILNNILYTLDIDNISLTITNSTESLLGFIGDSSIYAYHPITWFSDYYIIYSYDLDLEINWSQMAPQSGSHGYSVQPSGFAGNGKIYVMTEIGNNWDEWGLGIYNGNSAPDFTTPRPTKLLTSSDISSTGVLYGKTVFSNSKTRASFYDSASGIFYTDFNDMIKIADSSEYPAAYQPRLHCMSDHYIVVGVGGADVKVYKYR